MIQQYRPGDEIKTFSILRKTANESSIGRITTPINSAPIGILQGALSSASQREIDQWKQQNHPITHKVVSSGQTVAQAEDVLSLDDVAAHTSRRFYIQGKRDPGELGIRQVLYCEERPGMQNA